MLVQKLLTTRNFKLWPCLSTVSERFKLHIQFKTVTIEADSNCILISSLISYSWNLGPTTGHLDSGNTSFVPVTWLHTTLKWVTTTSFQFIIHSFSIPSIRHQVASKSDVLLNKQRMLLYEPQCNNLTCQNKNLCVVLQYHIKTNRLQIPVFWDATMCPWVSVFFNVLKDNRASTAGSSSWWRVSYLSLLHPADECSRLFEM